jgi:hypothetical protein
MLFTALLFWAFGGSQFALGDAALVVDSPCFFIEQKDDKDAQALRNRCKKMLDFEIALINETKRLHKKTEEKTELKNAMIELSKKQKQIALEAESIIRTLKAQKVAPAFWEVFEIIRSDSEKARTRISNGDVGQGTQAIEQDIADALNDMIRAFEMKCPPAK